MLCGNSMFGAKIKDEDILSLSEIRTVLFFEACMMKPCGGSASVLELAHILRITF